jgi:phosphoglycolate phosphatase
MERHYDVHCLDHTRPYDGIEELLSQLGDFKRAVISNKPDLFAKRIVLALFGDGFDVVMGQRQGVPPKPDPTGPIETCSLMGVQPAECLYLGDSGVDMLAARAAGMFAAGALWGFRDRQELVENGAEALVAAPQDLLDVLRAHH